MRAFHLVKLLALNVSLKQSYLKTAMAGKEGKRGTERRPGKIGVGVMDGGVGKRRLEDGIVGVKEIEGTILDGGKALIGREKEGWEVLVGLTRVGNYWTNGKVRIRCGKKGLVESDWKVWEDEVVVDTFEGKKEKMDEDVGMDEGVEIKREKEEVWVRKDVDEVIGGMLEGVRGEEWAKEKGKKRREEVIKEEVEVIDLCGSREEESGVGLLEEWREEKEAKEKREKDERRRREVEGMVNRGKDRGMRREDVLEMKQVFGDYEEVVGDVGYVLGIDVGLARCFVMDREIRKAVDMMMDGKRDGKSEKRRMSEGMRGEEVEVRSEVVVEEGLREKEELVRCEGVKGGRT